MLATSVQYLGYHEAIQLDSVVVEGEDGLVISQITSVFLPRPEQVFPRLALLDTLVLREHQVEHQILESKGLLSTPLGALSQVTLEVGEQLDGDQRVSLLLVYVQEQTLLGGVFGLPDPLVHESPESFRLLLGQLGLFGDLPPGDPLVVLLYESVHPVHIPLLLGLHRDLLLLLTISLLLQVYLVGLSDLGRLLLVLSVDLDLLYLLGAPEVLVFPRVYPLVDQGVLDPVVTARPYLSQHVVSQQSQSVVHQLDNRQFHQ